MIFYSPTDGDVHSTRIEYRPKTCFIMTQLGKRVPPVIAEIRNRLTSFLKSKGTDVIDANSVITGKDFLMKIWRMLLSVPLGVAIIHNKMTRQTYSNIFYEIGMMQAYGKETLVVKTKEAKVPSDFVRTEYLEFTAEFEARLEIFFQSFCQLAEHYAFMADQLDNNPLLAIDYLRRAYLISGQEALRDKAKRIFEKAALKGRAKNSVETLLVSF